MSKDPNGTIDDSRSAAELAGLDAQTMRNLTDKLYEKRKVGALEIEHQIKEIVATGDKRRLTAMIEFVTETLVYSNNANHRKGGLIALAAIGIGMGLESCKILTELVLPILTCFTDQDSRVRYYACEAMYNIAKVVRGRILMFFNELFDGLTKLASDPDPNVQNGSVLLDRLIKDVVAENENFDIEKFIPLLNERISSTVPHVRKFLLGWISVLDSVPDINIIQHLPKYLDGLFKMLSDKKEDIRNDANIILSEFLHALAAGNGSIISDGAIINILLSHCTAADELTRLKSLQWLHELVKFCGDQILPFVAALITGILPALSDEVSQIQEEASRANEALIALVNGSSTPFPIGDFLRNVSLQFKTAFTPTRMAALHWILLIHRKSPELLQSRLDDLFPALLQTLSDQSEQVIRLDLEVMAKISINDDYFGRLIESLVNLCSIDRSLLEARGSLIIRQLGFFIDPEKIYRQAARILEHEEDHDFANIMVEALNLILLTAPELADLRARLRSVRTADPGSHDLFNALYRCWSHNPAATFCLCLLSNCYEHASALVASFTHLDLNVEFFISIDKLVQLLESPLFLPLRLQLLDPHSHPFLVKALYGLLMLLPQSPAFELLKNRLSCVQSLSATLIGPVKVPETPPVDSQPLVQHFLQVQANHRQARLRKLQHALLNSI